jgi:peptidoglycan/LPS O-acetylase OafA/YrhL
MNTQTEDRVDRASGSGAAPTVTADGPARTRSRLPLLDVLRTFAVVLVLGRHIPPSFENATSLGAVLMGLWHRGGWIGVDLFFVLSGFLVSGLLFSEYRKYGSISIKRFLIRRGLKLYPAFYVMLTCMCGIVYVMHGFVPLGRALAELFFMQSYFPGLSGHTWTLGVEEHFYLVTPFVMAAFVRWGPADRPFRWIPVLFAVCAVALLGWRIINAMNVSYTNETHLFPTHLRFDSLLFGVLLSYFHQFHATSFTGFCRRYRMGLACCGAIGFAPFFLFRLDTSFLVHSVGYTVLYVSSGLLLMAAMGSESRDMERPGYPVRFLSWIGYHSYSIYLWHMLVQQIMLPISLRMMGITPSAEVVVAIYVFEAIAFGIVAARVIEVPVLRLRDRLWPSRSKDVTADTTADKSSPSRELTGSLLPTVEESGFQSTTS